MTQPVYTPYSTLQGQFELTAVNWIPTVLDQQRIQSYEIYEKIFWTVPTVFKISMRGTEDKPIYVPSARTIIDTTNRYLSPKFAVNITGPDGQSADSQAATLTLQDFFKRERFLSKFNGAKRFSLIQGDWVWHITAEPLKPVGSRISIHALDPSLYFPVFDPEDVTKIIAVHLAQLSEFDGDPAIRRQTYRKVFDASGETTIGITVEDGLYDPDNWFPLDAPALEVKRPEEELPAVITSIPVYHIKNFEEPGNPFGSSEIRGLERLAGALNQTMSDEDLALALDGIGMYATDAPQPVDPATGNSVPWLLGPGRVVHHPEGTTWERVTGVTSSTMEAFGGHYDRIWDALKQGSSTPDIAIGMVDVTAAESGVALALKLSPMLSKASEKDRIILDVHNQMFFDLTTKWYAAYEQTTFNDINVECLAGDALPVDREAKFQELNWMLDKGVIDTVYYREEVAKLGYAFPEDIGARVDAERQKQADEFAVRLGQESGNE